MICPLCNKQYDIFDATVCEDEDGKEGLWICPDCEVPLDGVESDDAERLQMAGRDRNQRTEIGGQKSETGLSIREKIKQAAINAIGAETEIIDEDRPFMDVPDIAEEITRSVMGIIKDDTVKEVVIGVRGGVASPVSVPEGVSVKIRDYDIDGCDDDDLSQDEGGGRCVERNYGAESMVYYVGDEDDGDPC